MHAIMHQDSVLGKVKGTLMTTHAVTLELPEHVYQRLQHIAQATQQSFDAVVLRAIQVGAPPSWEDAPVEFQADLAALDCLDDATLWHIARRRQIAADMVRYQELLEKNANDTLSDAERAELTQLRTAADRFMLRKVQAAAFSAGAAITFRPLTRCSALMSTYLSAELRQQVVEADHHRCAYCQTTEANTGQSMVVEHIIPEAQGRPRASYHS